jgi:hypothetical protein
LSKLIIGVLVLLVVAGGAIGIVAIFTSRDAATVQGTPPGEEFADQGARHLRPGERPEPYNSDPPTSGPHRPSPIPRDGTELTDDQIVHALELGNVVWLYGTPRPPAGLRALAVDLAGPYDPAVAEAGQAVILGVRPGTEGIVALAWRHRLQVSDGSDPALSEFTTYWLGRTRGTARP